MAEVKTLSKEIEDVIDKGCETHIRRFRLTDKIEVKVTRDDGFYSSHQIVQLEKQRMCSDRRGFEGSLAYLIAYAYSKIKLA